MNRRIKIIPVCLFLLICSVSMGQMKQFNYKRTLGAIHDQWHRIILPDDFFGNAAADLSDIRIFGITKNNDTLTAPYILQVAAEKIIGSDINFKLINKSQNNKGYYFTFELDTIKTINQIKLNFENQNFDWRASLDGSQDQQEWFTVAGDYRILSIENDFTRYQFTTLAFPDAGYRYFRLYIKSDSKPAFLSAQISKTGITNGKYKTYTIKEFKKSEEKQNRETNIAVGLSLPVPVSYLKVYVHDKFDYYRNISIKYLADSFKTEKEWKYNYSPLTSGTLNSVEKNEFKFEGTILKKLQLVIENRDNQPLKIDSVLVKGFEYTLLARFTELATYYLVYGNNKAPKPDYDIERFADKIPAAVATLESGAEESIQKENFFHTAPLFQDKGWLWVLMVIIIAVLGLFSVRMMKKA